MVVVVVALGATAALSLGARAVHASNEERLLRQRVKQAGAVLSAALPTVQTPLVAATEVVQATHADKDHFKTVLAPLVGPDRTFVSASIWPADVGSLHPLVVIGSRPVLESRPPKDIRALLARATAKAHLTVVGLLSQSPPRLAYAYTSARAPIRYVVYAEASVPRDRTVAIERNSAFSGLDYALYLGASENARFELFSSTTHLPLTGRRADVIIPFGDNKFHLVMTPDGELGGSLLARLQWILLVSGIALAAGAAALTERLVRQRERATRLADENAGLYAAQRSVAQTLQHSLLPEKLPDIPGLAIRARYVAGAADVDIGGDWYDVVDTGEGEIVFVVGDVSGRGLRAATIMASLRYATRAYAAQGDDPAAILTKLTALLDVHDDGHFATVLCGRIDVDRHVVTIANAGHPEPLVVDAGGDRFVSTNVGVPIGVPSPKPYTSVTIEVRERATLLAFTDGLVERRGESLDVGMNRVREVAKSAHASLDATLDDLSDRLTPDGGSDDIAILGIAWTS